MLGRISRQWLKKSSIRFFLRDWPHVPDVDLLDIVGFDQLLSDDFSLNLDDASVGSDADGLVGFVADDGRVDAVISDGDDWNKVNSCLTWWESDSVMTSFVHGDVLGVSLSQQHLHRLSARNSYKIPQRVINCYVEDVLVPVGEKSNFLNLQRGIIRLPVFSQVPLIESISATRLPSSWWETAIVAADRGLTGNDVLDVLQVRILLKVGRRLNPADFPDRKHPPFGMMRSSLSEINVRN